MGLARGVSRAETQPSVAIRKSDRINLTLRSAGEGERILAGRATNNEAWNEANFLCPQPPPDSRLPPVARNWLRKTDINAAPDNPVRAEKTSKTPLTGPRNS